MKNRKAELQQRAFSKLQHYLDMYPDEARALCESMALDLFRLISTQELTEWVTELELMETLQANDIRTKL